MTGHIFSFPKPKSQPVTQDLQHGTEEKGGGPKPLSELKKSSVLVHGWSLKDLYLPSQRVPYAPQPATVNVMVFS